MVVSRSGAVVHPCIKESGVPHSTRPITKRIAELPSLRYGTVGAKASGTGPLKMTTHYNHDTIPRNKKKSNGHSFGSDEDIYKQNRPIRRVRFALPTPDGDPGRSDAGVGVKPTAGDTGWMMHSTRGSTPFSHRSDARRSESAGRFGTSTSSDYHPHQNHSGHHYQQYQHQHQPNFHQQPHHHLHQNGTGGRHHQSQQQRDVELSYWNSHGVAVTNSPGVRNRVHPTGRYVRGTLSPTANASPHAAASPGGQALLRAARDGDDLLLRDLLRRAALLGVPESDLNAVDSSGRTVLSYVASNGSIELLEQILQLPGLNPNKPDNEGNTPLHFAAQAGQVECLNCMLSRCRGIEIDSRNNLGFTPLMKAALQGRNKCAKLLLFAGANPTLRDNGRGFRADQWARFCGRYVCADVIEKHARQRLLERSTSYGNWGGENELGARVLMGKVVPVPPIPQQPSNGLKSKLRRVFRTSSGLGQNSDNAYSSARLVTQLTSAALCASSPVLPSGPTVPPVVKSLIRPLTVPRLQITLVNNNGDYPNNNLPNGIIKTQPSSQKQPLPANDDKTPAIKPVRTKKKK